MNNLEPYALTEVQLAYMLGRSTNMFLGGNSTHFYVELDLACNIDKLEEAFNKVIEEQSMLRTVIYDDGTQQEYDGDTIYKIEVTELVGKQEEEINEVIEKYRSDAAQRIFPLNCWPMFALHAYHVKKDRYRLAMDFDMMVMDRFSIDLLMYRIYYYYCNPNEKIYIPKIDFRGYISKKEKYKEENYEEDKKFWNMTLDSIPGAPAIPYNHNVGAGGKFVYKERIIETNWQKQKELLFEKRIVPSVYVLVCYAKMLSIWSNQEKLTINMTTAKRNIGKDVFGDVIGDFTQLMLIDFDFSTKYESINEEILMCCKETQRKLRKYLKHDSYGGIEVMKEYAKRNNLESGDGFLFAFTSRIMDQETESFDGFIVNKGYQISQTPQLLLDCQVSELDDKLYLRWDYVEDGIESDNITDMFEAFCKYVEKCTDREQVTVSYSDIEDVMRKYNDTDEDIEETTLQTLFYRQQKMTPDAIAVVSGEESITYGLLQEKSSLVADEIMLKYGRGKAVAVVADRSIGTIVNMLGILKSGGYYIPISSDIPEERKKYILQASEAVAILEPDFYSTLSDRITAEDAYIGIGTPDDIAYVIYTSGSTGTPKGVVINQKSVCNTIIDINQKVDMGADDCIIGISAFVFDLSVYDIFGALSTGAKLVLAQSALDVDNLIEIIDKYHVTFWNTVPAIMELLVSGLEGRKIPFMKNVLLSGDWIPLDLPEKIKNIFSETEVISLGGATEGSIWSIYYPIGKRQKNWKSIPYGYPLANQKMYVLNYENKLCPYNVQGEICIGGIGVAREYQAAPEQTAKSFIMHNTYGYIYRTGDYGVFRRDGYIEFLGRKDAQTKIHGFRVELGEIEEILKKVDFVKESVAQVVTSTTGVQRLIGYVVTLTGERLGELERKSLYDVLEANLPYYMIPSDIYVIESVPLTPNGKVNKKALPVFEDSIESLVRKEAFTETEKLVVDTVAKILGIEVPGINQDLFDLGIDSMKCIQLLTQFKERGYRISLSELYEQSNLEMLAKLLEKKKDNNLSVDEKAFQIAPEDKWKPFRMTPLQEAYYVGRMQQKDKNALPTGGYIEVECKGYHHDRFEYCIQKLIAKHDMLRCKFLDGGIQQFVETVPYYNVPINDLRNITDKVIEIDKVRKRVSSSRLDLENPPLIAVEATLVANETAIIHIFMDGMIMDGWATELFLAELNSLYYDDKYMYEPVEVTFRDYVQYLNYKRDTEAYKADQEFWEKRIWDLPESVSLPMVSIPENVDEMHSAQIPCSLTMDEWKRLEQKAAKYHVTPFAILFTSFIYVMSLWNYKKRFLLNIPEFDVPDFHKDYSKVIGLCSSFLLFSAEIDWEKSFGENVRGVQHQLLELKQHSNYSGMDVIRSINRMQGGNSQGAVCPYVFGMVMEAGNISGDHKDEEARLKLLYQENHTSNIWIDINTIKYENKVAFNWNYIEELFERSMLQHMVEQQLDILHNLAYSEEYWSKPVDYKLANSYKKIIDSANSKKADYKYRSISYIIKDSCNKYADREFISTRDSSYTYKAVYQMCSCVAGQLKDCGCKKGDHIAVHMGKSVEQLVTILAIAYMGGVYVPLEYSYPKDLIVKCYKNTECVCILTDKDKVDYLDDNELKIVIPDLKYDIHVAEKPVRVSLDEEFVIIHTSGSTGVPKAVIVNQRGLINSLLYTNKHFGVTQKDKVIALTNIAHDMSMYDIFGMLLVGGGIVLPLERDAKNPIEWVSLIERYQVTIWNSVPAMQEMLQKVFDEKDMYKLASIRLFIHGGDYLKVPVAKWLYDNHKGAKIINVGGPTETTLWNIYHEVTKKDIESGIIPYGKPIANTKYYLLNENKQQVPIGVMGMMYCVGVGVTKGYYGNDKLTQEKYVINNITGERMYCTGDMGRYDKEGNIIFMGRCDNQVKINGKRIELNGIASIIMENDHVKECSVFEKDKEIIAFYTSDKEGIEEELRIGVAEQLPIYMMPKYFVQISEMKYMPNGKVDKNTLLGLVAEKKTVTNVISANYSQVEQKILDLYKEQLGEDIDLDTDFYMLGGNSLMLLGMIEEIKEEFGIEFDLSEVFGISTPREMAEYLESLM